MNLKSALLLLVAGLLVVGAGCAKKNPTADVNNPETVSAQGNVPLRQVSVEVSGLGKADLKGQLVILELATDAANTASRMRIEGRFTGAAKAGTHPVEIRKGTCSAIGDSVYPLGASNNGESHTVMYETFDNIGKALPLVLTVRNSESDKKTFLACGEITWNPTSIDPTKPVFPNIPPPAKETLQAPANAPAAATNVPSPAPPKK